MTLPVEENVLTNFFSGADWQAVIFASIISSAINLLIHYWKSKQNKKEALAFLIEDIVDLAINHWCGSTTDQESFRNRCISIPKKVDDIRWRIEKKPFLIVKLFWLLKSNFCKQKTKYRKMSKKTETLFLNFRREITGGKFSDLDKPLHPFESEKIDKIKEVTKNLRRNLKIERHH